jgi:hypothetical protein
MAQTLTVPVSRADVTQQAVTKMEFKIPHKRNVGDTAMEIDKTVVEIRYEVTTYNANGDILERQARVVYFTNWPAGFKTDMKAAYAKVETDAVNAGLIGAGTAELLE